MNPSSHSAKLKTGAGSSTTNTSERALEDLIVSHMTDSASAHPAGDDAFNDRPAAYGAGWIQGNPQDYDREYCLDLAQLAAFLRATQPEIAESLDLCADSPARRNFLARLEGQINNLGTVRVLRNGVKHGPHNIELMYGTPSPDNHEAVKQYSKNRFSVTRQLRYSQDRTRLALDLCVFLNGLPVATFELKNSLTKQTVADAVEQYRRDRDPREKLFRLGRCLVHFALDDHEIMFCAHLRGKASWFLPFNKGYNDGAGNPPNPNGIKTDYLWKRILTKQSLTDIIENYAQTIETKDSKTGRKRRDQIWPRYHQLDAARKLLEHAEHSGAGKRYLIQHSAGSGKSNTIAWLAHQLIGLRRQRRTVFDTIIVVTDRRILDRQIHDTIRQFTQVGAVVGHAESSADLRRLLGQGKRIVISTVQKFPFILDAIGDDHRARSFAIIIDEAHSSQGGRNTAAMGRALSEAGAAPAPARENDNDDGEVETAEDKINRIMEARKLLPNASYFAFTATPKSKTLELFGDLNPDGGPGRVPFHAYTMKQAIQEGFIIDVLESYTPVNSYYRLVKTVADDPEFDTKRAGKKLRRYVEEHNHAIRLKAEIMVDHFHEQVAGLRKIGGEARAMVVAGSVHRAISYHRAIQRYLAERKSPYKAIVAFSGERPFDGETVTEASLNGFSSNSIAEKITEGDYRFLVCADKFQTGYDEPLLHTMYVDKPLSGVRAVQTLSRLNRAHPKKHDAFILDFANDADAIEGAFSDYYRTTLLAKETDPNTLHDLKATLDDHQVYAPQQIEELVELYLSGADRDKLDPILDSCVAIYRERLDEDDQVAFKGGAKAFLRSYGFLAAILPYTIAEWEQLSIFLTFLVPKLPAPREDDLSKGILETIDMDSYRAEKQAAQQIRLPDADAEIEPTPPEPPFEKRDPELDTLSAILAEFNDRYGNIDWKDKDRVARIITVEIPAKVSEDRAYQNAMSNSDQQNARIEMERALLNVVTGFMSDDAELFKLFNDNDSFRNWLSETTFAQTYRAARP